MGATGTSADLISEVVLSSFGQLLRNKGFATLPVSVGTRKSPVFVLTGSAADLEAYASLPSEFEGVPVVRKLFEFVTAEEAAEVCALLRRLREPPVEPVLDVTENSHGGQCGRMD